MEIINKLNEQLKTAMREKQSKRLSAIRMLISEIKNEEKVVGNKRTDDEVIMSYHKKLLKALDQFPVDKQTDIREEIKIVEEFLPKMMSKEEIIEFIKTNFKNEDVNMKNIMPALKGKAVAQLIKEVISNWNQTV